jgi:hypothetical protein
MANDLKDADWQIMTQLQPIALERFCERTLGEIEQIVSDAGRTRGERCLEVLDLAEHRNRERMEIFEHAQQSTALPQLVLMHSHSLITPEELARFSTETRNAVELRLGSGA